MPQRLGASPPPALVQNLTPLDDFGHGVAALLDVGIDGLEV